MMQKKPPVIKFTKAGFDQIQADFDRLTVKRAEVLVRLQAAREMGDLSENGAYQGAKFELGSVDRQLRRLTYQLRYGKVVESNKSGRADFGSTIILTDGSQRLTFQLVSGFESDPDKQLLSTSSPIGKAVLGKKAGDEIVVEVPAGKRTFTILDVS